MKTFIIAALSLLVLPLLSQDAKQELSKMETFASKSGAIIRFEDHEMPNLKLAYGTAEVKIRKLTSGTETIYFLQISSESKYGTKTASIAEDDIKDIQEALTALREAESKDLTIQSDYIENGFITEDGFKIGYYISGKKPTWFMKLEKYGSGNTIFLNPQIKPEALFRDAINKISELK